MKKTKENVKNDEENTVKNKKGKHKANPTLGDIVFRVLIIVVIFFIALIVYVSYIDGIRTQENNNQLSQNSTRTIERSN